MHFHQAYGSTGIWTLSRNPREDELPDSYEDDNDPVLPPIHRYIETKMRVATRCSYCQSALEIFEHVQWDNPIEDHGIFNLTPDYARLAYCEYCGFWNWYSTCWNRGWNNYAALSVLKEFDASLPIGVNSELARHLRQNPQLWQRLSPVAMEKTVADIFRANFQSSEVFHVGKPGDGGIDVLFIDSDSHRWLIQVKRRRLTCAEPFETV